jgi:hypothetical protein
VKVSNMVAHMTTENLGDFALSVVRQYGLRVDSDMRPIKQVVDMFDFHQRTIREALDALERENNEQTPA